MLKGKKMRAMEDSIQQDEGEAKKEEMTKGV